MALSKSRNKNIIRAFELFGEGNYLFQLVLLVICAKRKTASSELLTLLMTLPSFDQCFF